MKRNVKLEDRRSTVVELTARGGREFERVFAPHVAFCKRPFTEYQETDFAALERELAKLKRHLEAAIADSNP